MQVFTMKTNLPDLPFTSYGLADLSKTYTHCASKATPRAYPRTDLRTFTPWTSFRDDIHLAIQSAMTHSNLLPGPLNTESGSSITRDVESEERIRMHAAVSLHEPVEEVLRTLGIAGRFALPGGGNYAIVGEPDFSWVTENCKRPHPKLIVCLNHYIHIGL